MANYPTQKVVDGKKIDIKADTKETKPNSLKKEVINEFLEKIEFFDKFLSNERKNKKGRVLKELELYYFQVLLTTNLRFINQIKSLNLAIKKGGRPKDEDIYLVLENLFDNYYLKNGYPPTSKELHRKLTILFIEPANNIIERNNEKIIIKNSNYKAKDLAKLKTFTLKSVDNFSKQRCAEFNLKKKRKN